MWRVALHSLNTESDTTVTKLTGVFPVMTSSILEAPHHLIKQVKHWILRPLIVIIEIVFLGICIRFCAVAPCPFTCPLGVDRFGAKGTRDLRVR